jgi:ABC-type Na+ efflux pump permease subunit
MKYSKIKKNLEKFFSYFLKDKIVEEVFALTFLLNLSIWIYTALKIKNIQGTIPLQYNFWGEAVRIGEAREVLYYPLIGLIILLGNLLLAFLNSSYFNQINKNNYFSYFILFASFLANVFLFLIVFQVLANI